MLLGSNTAITDEVLHKVLMNYLSNAECATIVAASAFSTKLQADILHLLSRFGCRQLPSPSNICTLLLKAVVYQFCNKPAAALL